MNTYEFDDKFLNIIKAKIEELKNTNLEEKEKKYIINEINELVVRANDWIDVEQIELDEEQGELNLSKESLYEETEELKKITTIYKCNNTIDMFEVE
jgi:hypothetical protein